MITRASHRRRIFLQPIVSARVARRAGNRHGNFDPPVDKSLGLFVIFGVGVV